MRCQSTHQFVHVRHPVGARVVNTDVEDVRSLFDLVTADAHARVPVTLEHGVTELLRAVRVGPFADEQHRAFLLVVRGGIYGRHRRLEYRRPCGRRERTNSLDDPSHVFRRRATTAPDDLDPVFGDELREVFCQGVRREVVVHLALDDAR